MRAITIRVTRRHIEDGERKACRRCPVALAVQETLGVDCEATLDGLLLIDRRDACGSLRKKTIIALRTPVIAREFMNRFDYCRSRKWLRPFSFTLIHPQLPPTTT